MLDAPSQGTITMKPDGTFSYTPLKNFNGIDSVHYRICDKAGACTTGTLIINVLSANDPPKATVSAPIIAEDTPTTFCGIISDLDAGEIFSTRTCNIPNGSINPIINNNQLCITYTPSKNFNGVDSICLLVCDKSGACDTVRLPIIVTPVNDVPILVVTPIEVPGDSTVIQCLAINDTDIGEVFSASICGTKEGTARIKIENNNLCVTYKVLNLNAKTDTVCVILCDKMGACSQANIPVVIKPCNDQFEPIISCPEPVEVSHIGTIVSDPSNFLTSVSVSDNCLGVKVTFKTPTATDDCMSNPIVQQTSGNVSGSIFSKGTSSIFFEAVDKTGKKAPCVVPITVSHTELIADETVKLCLTDILAIPVIPLSNAVYLWKGFSKFHIYECHAYTTHYKCKYERSI